MWTFSYTHDGTPFGPALEVRPHRPGAASAASVGVGDDGGCVGGGGAGVALRIRIRPPNEGWTEGTRPTAGLGARALSPRMISGGLVAATGGPQGGVGELRRRRQPRRGRRRGRRRLDRRRRWRQRQRQRRPWVGRAARPARPGRPPGRPNEVIGRRRPRPRRPSRPPRSGASSVGAQASPVRPA